MSEPSGHDPKLQLSSLIDGEIGEGDVSRVCSAWKDDESHRRDWHTWQLIGDTLRSEELAADPARDCDFMARLRLKLADEPVIFAPQFAVSDLDSTLARTASGGAMPARVAAAYGAAAGAAAGAAGSTFDSRRSSSATARRWRTPMTVAASVLAVTGVLMVARVSGLLPDGGAAPASGGAGAVAYQQAPRQVSDIQTVSAQAGPSAQAGQAASPDAGDASSTSLSAVQPQTLVASGKLIRDARLDQYLAAHKQFGGTTALGVPSGFLRSATSESRDR